jgi:prevent-host-death family protein
MTRASIAELKDKLSAYLREVEDGNEIEITNRGRPVARIVPIRTAEGLRVQHARRPFAEVRDLRSRSVANWGLTSTELLLEDRRRR